MASSLVLHPRVAYNARAAVQGPGSVGEARPA